MSLFIGMLAFTDPAHAAELRLGVLAGSLLSALPRAICVLALQRACAARIAGMILVSSVSARDRADVLVDDLALAVDDERLGHAVDAPFDGRAAVAIDADRGEGIAVAAEEAARGRRLVLVVDAVELHAGPLLEGDQQRVLLHARHAPGGPEVHDRDLARWPGRRWQSRRRGARRRETLQRRQAPWRAPACRSAPRAAWRDRRSAARRRRSAASTQKIASGHTEHARCASA